MLKTLAIVLALLSTPAAATDYELTAATYAIIQTGLFAAGMSVGPNAVASHPWSTHYIGADRMAIYCYGTKYISGVPQSGSYCILRWEGPDAVPAISGVTVVPLPANTNAVFF